MDIGLTLEELYGHPAITLAISVARGEAPIGSLERLILDGSLRRVLEVRGDDGTLYLQRYLVAERKNGGHIYVNAFLRPDSDVEPHDHPYDLETLIVCGGYAEEELIHVPPSHGVNAHTTIRRNEYRPGQINSIPAAKMHRVAEVFGLPTYTLVATNAKSQSWGFWDAKWERKIYWRGFAAWKALMAKIVTLPEGDQVVTAVVEHIPNRADALRFIADAADRRQWPGIRAEALKAIPLLNDPSRRMPTIHVDQLKPSTPFWEALVVVKPRAASRAVLVVSDAAWIVNSNTTKYGLEPDVIKYTGTGAFRRLDAGKATLEQLAPRLDCRLYQQKGAGIVTLNAILETLGRAGLALACGCSADHVCATRPPKWPKEK